MSYVLCAVVQWWEVKPRHVKNERDHLVGGFFQTYCKTSNIRCTQVDNKILIAKYSCSNYILILDLALGFTGLGKDNCKMKQETVKSCNLVHLIL